MPVPAIGRAVPRKEGREKVTGAARYVDDITFPGLLHGVTVRSSAARGRIRAISFEGDLPWDEIVVVTAADIPGRNVVRLILDDQPCLADGVVNHPEEPIVLLAHADRHLLEEARRRVRIEIESLPAVFENLDDALAARDVVWGTNNILASYTLEKGDVERAFREADRIVVGEYTTGAQEHVYIEPQGMVAIAGAAAGVTVWGSLQCPYYVHKALAAIFEQVTPEKIRVVQTATGGGFGGKEEYPSLIAAHAALLSWKSGSRPVKIVYDRVEDMAATTKRHPSRTRHRTAVSKDGRILAMDIDFVIDGGAYATLSSVVLSRGTIHAAGPYHVPNVRVSSKAVATNHPPHGAFRGFGAPQSTFAVERHMEKVARAVGLESDELRRRNFLREGLQTATGQVVREPVALERLLEKAFIESGYREKRARHRAENPIRPVKRGMGLATFFHGAGFTGAGETYLASVAGVEVTAEGRFRVLAASTEIGQGTSTIFAQIAADALGVDYDRIEVAPPDTAMVPDSGPTVASRTCMVVGNLILKAALEIKKALVARGCPGDPVRFVREAGPLRVLKKYEPPPGIEWDEKRYRGDAYGTYAWAVYVAEVEVDTIACSTSVIDFVAVQEVGRVVHPVLAAGQIEGGVAQGIGFALHENVVWNQGRMQNCQLTNYIIPTSADVPPIRVFFEEFSPYAHGAAGAKGIGELPLDGTAPAIVNAIEDAIGVSIDRIPVTGDVLLAALERSANDVRA